MDLRQQVQRLIAINSTGPVTSVALTAPTGFSVTGSPGTGTVSLGLIYSGTFPGTSMPAFTGDVTTTAGSTATTISNSVVTNAKLANMAAFTLKGNNTGISAVPTDLNSSQVISLLGAIVNGSAAGGDLTGTYPNPSIGTNVVTNAQRAQMPANTIKGNNTAGTANEADLTVAQTNTLLGTVTTTGAQSIAGNKTFSNNIIPQAYIQWLTGVAFPAVLSVNGQGYDYVSSTGGRVIYGCGSSYDVLIATRGGSLIMGGVAGTQDAQFGGSIDVSTVGSGLKVAEGTNAKQGTATLVAGTVTVSNASVTANSRIFLTAQNTGGTPGALRVSARTAGTSFTITSTSGTDTSLVAYEIFEPG